MEDDETLDHSYDLEVNLDLAENVENSVTEKPPVMKDKLADVQVVDVDALEVVMEVEADAVNIDENSVKLLFQEEDKEFVRKNSVKMSQYEEFVRIVVDPSVSFIALVYMQASLLDSE